MGKSAITVVSLFVLLYLIWVFSVFAEPPFPDMQDWPKTDFSRHSVPLDEMIEGGPGKDGIPSIDSPVFETIAMARKWLSGKEPVVAVTVGSHSKAYPLQILMYHEIVNDRLNGQDISITYCPLCNAAMVFSRNLNDQVFDFGTSGKVHTSNLVMYDRQTETWWLQFTGEAVVGKHMGERLKLLPSQIVSFEHFKSAYPEGEVLSRDTGVNKKYGINPYANYDSRLLPIGWFFRKPFDDRLPAMERVLGVVIDEHATAFPLSNLNKKPLIQTQINEQEILVISKKGMVSPVDKRRISDSRNVLAAAAYSRMVEGKVLDFEIRNETIVDTQTGSLWNMFGVAIDGEYKGLRLKQLDRGVYFSFVWLDFYPESLIFESK